MNLLDHVWIFAKNCRLLSFIRIWNCLQILASAGQSMCESWLELWRVKCFSDQKQRCISLNIWDNIDKVVSSRIISPIGNSSSLSAVSDRFMISIWVYVFFYQEHRGLLSIRYPMEHGIVKDWNDMEKIWQYIYSKDQLQTYAEEVSMSFSLFLFC